MAETTVPIAPTATNLATASFAASATGTPTATASETPTVAPAIATTSPTASATITAAVGAATATTIPVGPPATPKPTTAVDAKLQAGQTLTRGGALIMAVPSGMFLMGSKGDPLAFGNETPQHALYLDAFWMDRDETTNGLYAQCVAAKACRAPTQFRSNLRAAYYGAAEFLRFRCYMSRGWTRRPFARGRASGYRARRSGRRRRAGRTGARGRGAIRSRRAASIRLMAGQGIRCAWAVTRRA